MNKKKTTITTIILSVSYAYLLQHWYKNSSVKNVLSDLKDVFKGGI